MVAKTEAEQSSQCSHLFMLRLWLEDLGNGQTDWRGKVQYVNSGEARYFRDWSILEAFMEWQIHQVTPKGNTADGIEETDRSSR